MLVIMYFEVEMSYTYVWPQNWCQGCWPGNCRHIYDKRLSIVHEVVNASNWTSNCQEKKDE